MATVRRGYAGNTLPLSWCPGWEGGCSGQERRLSRNKEMTWLCREERETLVFHSARAFQLGQQKRSISQEQAQHTDEGEEDRVHERSLLNASIFVMQQKTSPEEGWGGEALGYENRSYEMIFLEQHLVTQLDPSSSLLRFTAVNSMRPVSMIVLSSAPLQCHMALGGELDSIRLQVCQASTSEEVTKKSEIICKGLTIVIDHETRGG